VNVQVVRLNTCAILSLSASVDRIYVVRLEEPETRDKDQIRSIQSLERIPREAVLSVIRLPRHDPGR
jgi:hypothetical protein